MQKRTTIKLITIATMVLVGIFFLAPSAHALWVYEQKFNTLTDGDINGQDSWTAGSSFDIQTSVMYEGAKALQATGDGETAIRAFTAITDGTIYIAVRKTSTSDGELWVRLREGGADKILINLNESGNITYHEPGVGYNTYSAYSANQWYVLEIAFDESPNTYTLDVHNGTAWQGATASTAFIAATQIDDIKLVAGSMSSATNYWDTITPTDPTVVPPADDPVLLEEIIWF